MCYHGIPANLVIQAKSVVSVGHLPLLGGELQKYSQFLTDITLLMVACAVVHKIQQ